MTNHKRLFRLFILLAIIQLAVPFYMVWRWEDVLHTGKQYTWVAAPIDPYDALMGRYVDLRFKEMTAPILGNAQLHSGQTVYAMIAEDQDGYAFISGVSTSPLEGNSYVKTHISYVQDNNIAHFLLPFTRYYMQEELAPVVEKIYTESVSRSAATVSVRVKDGYGVLEELYIGDQSIYEYLHGKSLEEGKSISISNFAI